MTERRLFSRLLLVPTLALVACEASPPGVQANLRLSLAQTSTPVTYAEAVATQGDTTTRAVMDENGEATLHVVAGLETRLGATLFQLQPQVWNDLEGTHIFEPVPGDNQVSVEVAPVALRQVSLLPAFDGALALNAGLPVQITDDLTGFAPAAGSAPLFLINAPIALPVDRAFTLTFVRPDTQEPIQAVVPANADPSVPIPLPLGAPPILVAPPPVFINAGSTVDLSGFAVTGFTVECAVGYSCDENLTWTDCSAEFATGLESGEQGTVEVQVRVAEVPGLGCVAVDVVSDGIAPVVRVSVDPPYVSSTAAGTLTITLMPNERLQGLSATAAGGVTGTCTTFSEAPGMAGVPSYSCAIPYDSLASATGTTVTVTGTDEAGNAFTAQGFVPYLATVPDVAVVGVRTAPAVPSSSDMFSSFYLGIDLVNTGATTIDACSLMLSAAQLYTAQTGGTTSAGLTIDTDSTLLTALPKPGASGAPTRGTLWVHASVTQSGGLTPGTYWLGDFQLSYNLNTTPDCTGQSQTAVTPPVSTDRFGITFAPPVSRVLADGPLVIGLPPWPTQSSRSVLETPYANSPFNGDVIYAMESSNPAVIASKSGGGSTEVLGLGDTDVRIFIEPGHEFLVRVPYSVVQGTELLALQDKTLVRMSAAGRRQVPLSADIGNPLRVLWEASRNVIAVLGDRGVQVIADSGVTTIPDPCGVSPAHEGTTVILDAALSAVAPAFPANKPDLLLLVTNGSTFSQCRMNLDTADPGTVTALPAAVLAACGAPQRIAADPVGGRILVLGSVAQAICAASYTADAGGLTAGPRLPAVPPLTGINTLTDAQVDWQNNFVTLLGTDVQSGGAKAFAGIILGPTFTPVSAYDYQLMVSTYPARPDAIAVNTATNGLYVSAVSNDLALPGVPTIVAYSQRAKSGGGTGAPVPSAGSYAAPGRDYNLSHMVVDAGNQILYAADTWTTPGVWPLDLVAGGFAVSSLTGKAQSISLGTDEVTRDLALAGPQPTSVEPQTLSPGSIATIQGVGFAGGGADEVFVMGVKATVLSSTLTSVTFRVPAGLDDLDADVWGPGVTVRSHERLSGAAASTRNRLVPRRANQVLQAYDDRRTWCFSPPCGQPTFLGIPQDTLILYPNPSPGRDELTDLSLVSMGYNAPLPNAGASTAALRPGGRRALGFTLGSTTNVWRDFLLEEINLAPFAAPTLKEDPRNYTTTLTGVTHVATDPSGRLVAATSAAGTTVWWAAGLTQLGTALSGSPQALAFSPDGTTLVVAGAAGAFDVVDVQATPTVVTAGLQPTGCPSGTPTLLGLWPDNDGGGSTVRGLLSYTTPAAKLASFAITLDGGSASGVCDRVADTRAATTYFATLSPVGHAVAVAEAAASSDFRVRLLSLDDLSLELDRVTSPVGAGPFVPVAMTNGINLHGSDGFIAAAATALSSYTLQILKVLP